MADSETPNLTMLDEVVQENHIQMIKAAIPYINIPLQKFAAIYTKILELNNTVAFFDDTKGDLSACSLSADSSSPLDMLNEIKCYCSESEQEMVDVMINFMNASQLYNTYRSTMEYDENVEAQSMPSPLNMVKAFLSPEQQNMFDTYSMLFNT